MESTGIVFDQVWKKFRRGEFHDSLRDLVPAMARKILRRGNAADADARADDFWALQDVSFSVSRGQALGIIGPNGAGKSTVLKLLTGILQPTRGHCEMRGRVGALIEVAAGFHPDLTGRENVFLQGTIMGMSRNVIRERFDQIVEFSGIEAFLDMPVKRYSSGMNARLGFAIAAHLDPDVLIIDEVLSVGDVAFQTRAFGRLREIVRSGIPVVVVSHQLDRVSELCDRALLLDQGRPVLQGTPAECIQRYMTPMRTGEDADAGASGIQDLAFPDGGTVRSGEWLRLRVRVRMADGPVPDSVEPLAIVVRSSQTGAIVAAVGTSTCDLSLVPGEWTDVETSLQMNVGQGIYLIETVVWDRKASRTLEPGPAAAVIVEEGPRFFGSVQLNAQMRVAADSTNRVVTLTSPTSA